MQVLAAAIRSYWLDCITELSMLPLSAFPFASTNSPAGADTARIFPFTRTDCLAMIRIFLSVEIVIPVSSSSLTVPLAPPSKDISRGYRFISFPCSVTKERLDGSLIRAQLDPLVRTQFTAMAACSSQLGKYSDTRVPTWGIQYIMFPVSGRQVYG